MTGRNPFDALAAEAFQRVLRSEMRDAGLSPEVLRARSGVSPSHLRFMLQGKDGKPIAPQIGTFVAVALGLDIPAIVLMDKIVREMELMASGGGSV